VPAGRVAALNETFADSAFRAEAEKIGLEINRRVAATGFSR
jgi:ADP-ribose pyrophosphatase YjhB (NUDIX family)